MYLLSVAVTAILIPFCTSQSKLCVWNSIETRDHYNGEYIMSSGTQLNKPYWTKSTTCPSPTHYLMLVSDNTGEWWMLDDELQPNYIAEHPYCDGTYADPTLCPSWHWWLNHVHNDQLPITVSDGPCPSLQCNKIRVAGTGQNECDTDFTKVPNTNNIYVNGITYLYFNPQTFKWYCSDTLGDDECDDDDQISHFYISSQDDGWFDVDIWQSEIWTVNNGNSATFQCIGPTSQPTSDPTATPTNMPTESTPTAAPTNMPIQFETSTLNPTDTPTHLPIATNTPTILPTGLPSNSPSNIPTNVPTSFPTTKILTNYPSASTDTSMHPSIISTETQTTLPTLAETETELILPTVAPTENKQEHSVDDHVTTAQPMNDHDAPNKSMKVIEDNKSLIVILGVALLIISLIVICSTAYICCVYRKTKKETSELDMMDTNASHVNISSMSMSTVAMTPGADFFIGDTPNLTAMNAAMDIAVSGEFGLVTSDTPGGDIGSVAEPAEGDGTGTDEELYAPTLPHQVTMGGPQNDLLDYVGSVYSQPTKGGDILCTQGGDDEIYANPNEDSDDLLQEAETENIENIVALEQEDIDHSLYED